MKWRSFDAVIPTYDTLVEEAKRKNRSNLPILSEEQIMNIETKISTSYETKSVIDIIYFYNYQYFKTSSMVVNIDYINKKIILHNNKIIYFKQIIEVD